MIRSIRELDLLKIRILILGEEQKGDLRRTTKIAIICYIRDLILL